MSSPLVTFVILGYKQEQYIREAVEGALAQDYSPLEIILSDDCSPDGTFAIMQEMAAAYHGPHRVILNRPPHNLGLSAHLDHAVKQASGEWIVIAAGDDISLPDRVSKHMQLATQYPEAHSIFLAAVAFGGGRSDNHVPLPGNRRVRYPETLKQNGGGYLGATHAARRTTWQVFGDLGPGITCEDWVIAFRSSLLGDVVCSNLPGVRYRLHEMSITSQIFGGKPYAHRLRAENNALMQFSKDLKIALRDKYIVESDGEGALEWLNRAIDSNRLIIDCYESNTTVRFALSCMRLLSSRKFVVGSMRRRFWVIRDAIRIA